MYPLPTPKPLHKHQYRHRHFVTPHFSLLTNMVLTLFVLLSLALEFTVGEISTLAYEAKTLSSPEILSVAYCTHIMLIKLMLKNRRYTQILMFTATGGPTQMPPVVLGYSVGAVG